MREHFHQQKSHLDLLGRWVKEYGEYSQALLSPIGDIYAYSKQVRSWLRGWDQRTESAIREALRRRMAEAEYDGDEGEVMREHFHQQKSHLDLLGRWVKE